MEFKVKQFAQLMILSHEITLSYDAISGGNTMIDLYQVIEHPQIVKGRIEDFMKSTFYKAMRSGETQELYKRLYNAENDGLFRELLKIRNENLNRGVIIS